MSNENMIGKWYVDKNLKDPHLDIFLTLKDKKISVMGGCGQVGSHIITKLYELGFPIDNIYANDNLSLGIKENLPVELRDRVDTRSHLEYARDPKCKPDIVIFVGGRSSAPHFESLTDVMQEIQTWQAILEWCVNEKIRLIFASTSSLCKELPSTETQKIWPGSLYELTKLLMEEMAIQQSLCEDLIFQVCRFFSVYGVTEQHKGNFGNLYTQMLWHAIKKEPFEVWGQEGVFNPGEQTRDTIFAPEVARAVLFLLTLPDPKPKLDDISELAFNIGQGKPVSVNEMIDHIEAFLPSDIRSNIVHAQVPINVKNYVVHTWGDPKKIIEAGFMPTFQDNTKNLKFIYQAISDADWYWSIIENIRNKLVTKG